MKNITKLMDAYHASLKKIESKNLAKHKQLKYKIQASKRYSHQIRVYVRDMKFKDLNEEITFFKTIKPSICGEIKFLKLQMAYKTEKPFVSVEKQKKYIHRELRRLESKKKKNINFYRYIKQGQTALDEMYFVRGNEQLALFSQTDYPDIDPEFTTSHDLLASEVVTYHLLSNYFKQELHCLSNLEAGCYDTLSNNLMTNNFTWTASKTDLVELIYALKISGVINSGDTPIKEITQAFGKLFNIELGSYYKTYSDIKNRTSNQTKFLDQLALNLVKKLELDNI